MTGVETVLAVAAVASAAIGGASAIASGNSQANAANYQAQVAANNNIVAQQNASYALKAGAAKEEASRLQTAAVTARQKAIQGASGLDVESGSPIDVRSGTSTIGELDALTIRNNAAREAYGYQVQGGNFDTQGELDKAAASNDSTSGYLNASSSILGSASSIASKFGTGGSGSAPSQSQIDAYAKGSSLLAGG